MKESNQLKFYQKQIRVTLLIIIASMVIGCSSENYEQEVYGKYYTGDSHVVLNQDKTWSWVGDYGESIANGTYRVSFEGKWFNGPKYWSINFDIKHEKYPNSFDPTQHVYYHDYNQITGERNYYRLNGMMPSTGASTDFIKR